MMGASRPLKGDFRGGAAMPLDDEKLQWLFEQVDHPESIGRLTETGSSPG